MPRSTPTPTQPSCLLQSLRHHLFHNNLSDAVATLPLLARRGLRPPFQTLAHLLSRCLRSPITLHLARRVHLFLHLTALKPIYPSHPFLSNQILSLYFHLHRPDDARQLFDKMPHRNVFSYNAMLAGYARLGMLRPARRLFDNMPVRDVVSWNTMIIAFARGGQCRAAIEFYLGLRCSSIGFNAYTFSGLITACVRLESFALARQVHGQVLVLGFLSNLVISSSLIDGYAKFGPMDDARRLFDEMVVRDVFSWTSLMYGYVTCGDLVSARRVFDEMPERNSVSWAALIGGYARHGLLVEAFDLFRRMVKEGVRPDQFTFSSCLCACGAIASMKHGKQIHAHFMRTRFNPNAIVLSSLIDMYSKCGDLKGSRRVFDLVPVSKRDSVLWNTMMSAVGQHGHGREAIGLFEEMVRGGTKPTANTFVVLLTACSHSGLVAEGVQHFECMAEKYKIVPEEDHYACLVDLLGRAGRFEEAVEWLSKMPCQSSARPLNALLAACRSHGNSKLGREAAGHLMELVPQCSATYVLLSNLYAEDGKWEDVEKVRQLMEEKRVRKEQAASWIEIGSVVDSFGASDQSLPLEEGIDGAFQHLDRG